MQFVDAIERTVSGKDAVCATISFTRVVGKQLDRVPCHDLFDHVACQKRRHDRLEWMLLDVERCGQKYERRSESEKV